MLNKIENLEIEKIAFKGYGLGFYENHPVFIPYTLPGDIVNIKIKYKKKDAYFGKITEYIKHSENYQEPQCEAFGQCGGCDWLNTPYDTQADFKNIIIKDIFRNTVDDDFEINPVVKSPQKENYRNKSYLPVAMDHKKPICGMYAKLTHKVITHKKCFIQPELFDKISNAILTYAEAAKVKIYNENTQAGILRHIGFRYSEKTNEILVILVTKIRKLPFSKQLVNTLTKDFPNIIGIVQNINSKPVNTIIGDEEKILFGRNYINDKFGHLSFKLDYKSFFQVNSQQAQNLYSFVKDSLTESDFVIDAFSGIGSIGLFISDKVKKVYCVERNEYACADAVINQMSNNVKNCEFIIGKVEEEVPKLCSKHTINAIIFDPPRRGLEKDTILEVAKEKIQKIIYISCNPSTQARDLDIFKTLNYKISKMQPFDMFPQTYHIENIAILEYIK